jgi:hypothetical protein
MAVQPKTGPGLPFWGFVTITFLRAGLLVQRATPNLEDQVSVFMTHGDRVTQIYPQALATHFSRFYDMHGLQWDCSSIPATTRELA